MSTCPKAKRNDGPVHYAKREEKHRKNDTAQLPNDGKKVQSTKRFYRAQKALWRRLSPGGYEAPRLFSGILQEAHDIASSDQQLQVAPDIA